MNQLEIHPGRGPRLPNTRISVQDLLPHFKRGETDEQIARLYPTIGLTEVRLFRQHYLDHTEEVLAYEKQLATFHHDLRKKNDRPSSMDSMSPAERIAYFKDKFAKKQAAEANGAHRMVIV